MSEPGGELRVSTPPSWRVDPFQIWRDIWRYRELVRHLALAQRLTRSAETVLGPLWWILMPLLEMLLYLFVVGILFRSQTPHLAVSIFLGLVAWQWFAQTALSMTTLLRNNSSLLLQISLPPSVLVAAKVLEGFLNLLYGYGILVALALLDGVRPDGGWLLIPVVLLVHSVYVLTVALVVAAVSVFLEDLRHAGIFLFNVWFYLTPVVYDASLVPERLRPYYDLNPLAALHGQYRALFFGTPAEWRVVGVVAIVGALGLLAAAWLFTALGQYFHKRL